MKGVAGLYIYALCPVGNLVSMPHELVESLWFDYLVFLDGLLDVT